MTLPKICCWNVRGFTSSDRVLTCKRLIAAHHIDFLCILEAKISSTHLNDQWFFHTHMVFSNEESYDNFNFSNPGRIWLKWNSDVITFTPSFRSSQLIHGVIQTGDSEKFWISVVYAANSLEERKSLWSDLESIAANINSPWIIMGDFNCFKDANDKMGGAPPHFSQLGELNNWYSSSGTFDLASTGLHYTWFNQRASDPVHVKLDRMMVNQQWLDLYPKSFYKVEPPGTSDHSPILLNSGSAYSISGRFQFKDYWTNMEGYWSELIAAFSVHFGGSPICNLYGKLRLLKSSLKKKEWADSSFIKCKISAVEQRQSHLLSHINANPLDPFLNAQLKDINGELHNLNSAWSSWIIQRAKARWLSNGEDDLGFLYARIKSRGNHNRISELTTTDGTFSTHKEIAIAAISYFKNLYNTPTPCCPYLSNLPAGATIPPHLILPLIASVTNEEIKTVVFSGPNASSPGPDGFTFSFYKKSWEVIGLYVCNAVKHFFSMGTLPPAAKATAIALIPKHSHASNISDYRPISLCNVLYKIIAKILANRLKEVFPFIIHKSQSGFISNRIASDNIVLAADILRTFNAVKAKKIFCAKLDIKKAFDTVSRDFLIQRLFLKGFPEQFINWIKGCILDTPFSVNINGSLEGFFKSSSGLRQGCSLSPLLFTVVMDAFSCMLDEGEFKGISCGNMDFNHLLYADDVLVFGEASLLNAKTLKDALNSFAASSGLCINDSKSSVLFSTNTINAMDISTLLGFSLADQSFSYLGLPISIKNLTATHFQPLLSKLSTLLAGWKVKFLSFAGRIQYLKFTIANIIAYWIRGAILSKSCCKIIDRLCSRFLFHGSSIEKKLHLISWKKTCLPTELGGLGIPSIQSLSFGFSCSFIWRFFSQNSLTVDWLRQKYLSPFKPPSPKASKYWSFTCSTATKLKPFLKFVVTRENCSLDAIWDPWINGSTVSELLHISNSKFIAVQNFVYEGYWQLSGSMLSGISHYINSIPILQQSNGCVEWVGSGKPSFKTFRKLFFVEFEKVSWASFIWHKRFALRYSSYGWLAVCDGLKTADILRSRNIITGSTCHLCGKEDESILHMFFTCEFSFGVISALLPSLGCFLFRPSLLQSFEFFDDMQHLDRQDKNFCFLVICCSVYFLWRERNVRCFEGTSEDMNYICFKISQAIKAKTKCWKSFERLNIKFPHCFLLQHHSITDGFPGQ
ncbi:Putative ribonuclease H protein [Dendrobium catenatum]|uniref:Ribonuclease H protein n=1 Tax=Dendrobium catenatum TaxID=906689 RepID=A0A2I0VN50_9ASPA|nr:Putative ribonuclease H protein [Dendrobium catenatum]